MALSVSVASKDKASASDLTRKSVFCSYASALSDSIRVESPSLFHSGTKAAGSVKKETKKNKIKT